MLDNENFHAFYYENIIDKLFSPKVRPHILDWKGNNINTARSMDIILL